MILMVSYFGFNAIFLFPLEEYLGC